MKEKIKYTDEPIGKVKVISDFLPSPEELALKDETVKVTIALSKSSVDFFKKEAKKYIHNKYVLPLTNGNGYPSSNRHGNAS